MSGIIEIALFVGDSNTISQAPRPAPAPLQGATFSNIFISQQADIYNTSGTPTGAITFPNLDIGVNSDGQGSTFWGPESQFAYNFNANHPGRNLYIVKMGRAGSSLGAGGAPVTNWDPNGTDPIASMFPRMNALLSAAKSHITGLGATPVVRTLFIGLGFNDATDSTLSAAYAANQSAFIPAALSAWGTTDTKVVVSRISINGGEAFLTGVYNAQTAVTGAHLVNTDSYAVQSASPIHFDTAGQISWGNDLYPLFQTGVAHLRW